MHNSFIRNQITRSSPQAILFVICVALSILSMVSLGGFSESIRYSLLKDARSLLAADIVVRSYSPLSEPVTKAVDKMARQGAIRVVRVLEFYSMAKDPVGNNTLLSKIKVVGPGYPLYGRVELSSQNEFETVLKLGSVIVENNLLERLDLSIGSYLKIGQARFRIDDVVVKEPDRPVSFFSLGPRVFVSEDDLSAMALVDKGSRIKYGLLIKVTDPNHVDRYAADLKGVASDHERIETFQSGESRIKRMFDNLLFFLKLVGLFTLLLAGFGIQSALISLLRENEDTIAMMKTMGADSRFVMVHFSLVVLLLGAIGTTIGVLFGFLIQHLIIFLLKSLLPYGFDFFFSWKTFIQGLVLGLWVVLLFAFIPLLRLKDIKPAAIFRKERMGIKRSFGSTLAGFGIVALFSAVIVWQLQDAAFSVRFVAGGVCFALLTAGAVHLILSMVKTVHVSALAPRQSLKGLFRPGNATRLIMITLTASLTVVYSVTFLELNLDASFLQSYPPDAPNLYFLDIQPDQKDAFSQVIGTTASYYPIIRARIASINGNPVDRSNQRRRRRDNLSRVFNLTYRNHLLADERVIKGSGLFNDNGQEVPVSVLDTVQEMADIDIGDSILFRIQGIPMKARVSSIRSRSRETIQPYFYFVFPADILEKAPQTIFTALRVHHGTIASLQNRVVDRFPNVSVIDVTRIISTFAGVMRKLSTIIRFYTTMSIAAGICILISAILSTRLARARESAYYKILGAKQRFIFRVFAYENLFIGGTCALLAAGFSQIVSFLISSHMLHISYRPFWGASLLMVAMATTVVWAAGALATRSIVRKKPIMVLREQTEG